MSFRIAYLPGDGAGPEVANAARQVVEVVASRRNLAFEFVESPFGGCAIDETGHPFPPETKELCLNADAVLLGAVGGPNWDDASIRPEAGLLELRKSLGVFANLRPVTVLSGMEEKSPLKSERAEGVDILIIRELTGGVYFGAREEGTDYASDQCAYSKEEVERVARIAFDAARKRRGKVTSVDKANVMATGRLWRAAVNALHEAEYKDVSLEHVLVDAMAMKLIQAPGAFDVVLTENMFGDILSDEASVIAGSIGLAPSASLGQSRVGLYEPIHGSAPDIAGQDNANPIGAILSAAMMLRYSFGENAVAEEIEKAIDVIVRNGHGTPDLGGSDGTKMLTKRVCEYLDG